jgi:hypothetical protein
VSTSLERAGRIPLARPHPTVVLALVQLLSSSLVVQVVVQFTIVMVSTGLKNTDSRTQGSNGITKFTTIYKQNLEIVSKIYINYLHPCTAQ